MTTFGRLAPLPAAFFRLDALPKSRAAGIAIDLLPSGPIDFAFSGRRPIKPYTLMKRLWPLLGVVFVSALGVFISQAGTISYLAIPSTQSDSNCGISRDHGYTTAVDGGNTRRTDRVINGITLYALSGAGQNTATADNCTVNALSGSLTDAGLTSKNIAADGTLREVMSDMVFNNAGGDNSQIEVVLDPESLEEGSTYDLRVYICSSSGQSRQVNLAFFGDGQTGIETGFFNEDDARTSAGRFQSADQVYYISYRYTWDGDSTPGITITQKSGGAPFCLYALTNELVSEGQAAAAGEGGQATAAAGAQGGGSGEAAGGEAEGEGDDGLSSGLVDQESDEVGVESDDFYGSESLNSNGRWVKLSKWGSCWQPTNVASGWCPYTNGSWKECDDCGWTFVSDEPWAWACYHYGRWAKVGIGCGWAWVPGKVWAPSWVSWRQGKDESCLGWAALPPEAGCDLNVGISSWVDSTCDIGPECYTFVNIRDFGSDSYFGCGCIYDRFRNTSLIIDTFNCTNICWNRHVNIYCGGPDYNWCNTRIRQLGGKECGTIHVNRYDNPGKNGGKWAKRDGENLGLVSPRIHGGNAKNHPKIAESAGADKIDHGWKGVKDKKQEQQLRNHIAKESKGKNPRNSPAKLPKGVAEKMKNHQGGRNAGLGQGQGGQAGKGTGGLRPGDKRHGQGGDLQGGAGQAQGGAAGGGDQHPGKGGRRKGQGQVAGGGGAGGAGGAGQGAGFNQHPGKNRGRGQGGQGMAGGQGQGQGQGKGQGKGRRGGAGANNLVGGNQQGGGNQNAGGGGAGGTGGRHPGQSFKKQKGGGAGGGTAAQGGGAGGQGHGQAQGGGAGSGGKGKGKRNRGQGGEQGMNQQQAGGGGTQGGQQANATGGQGQSGGGKKGGKGHSGQSQGFGGAQAKGSGGQKLRSHPQGQGQGHAQGQGQGQGGGQAATGAGGGRGKSGHRQQSQSTKQSGGGGGQGQGQVGGGGQGRHRQSGGQGQGQQQQLQQQQQMQRQRQQQQQQQLQQQRQQGGGGGGGGKRKRGQGTPPPR
jgi:hypothetical protein